MIPIPPQRLVDVPPREEGQQASVALFRRLGPPPELAPEALVRIGQRLGQRPARRRPAPIRRGRVALVGLAMGFAVQAGAVAGHRVWEVARPAVRSLLAPVPRPTGVATARARTHAAAPETAPPLVMAPVPVIAPLPTVAPPTAPPPPSRVERAVRAERVAMAPQPPIAPPSAALLPPLSAPPLVEPPASPLSEEVAELKVGLAQKHDGDLVAAVTTLETFRQRHPHGLLTREAALAELEGQIALGRDAEALQLVGGLLDQGEQSRSEELHLVRAELEVRLGHCSAALPAFERALAVPDLGERAHLGRGTCLQALGRVEESRQELELFLKLYPSSAHAAEVRRTLGAQP